MVITGTTQKGQSRHKEGHNTVITNDVRNYINLLVRITNIICNHSVFATDLDDSVRALRPPDHSLFRSSAFEWGIHFSFGPDCYVV
jgi:hypothetical protein